MATKKVTKKVTKKIEKVEKIKEIEISPKLITESFIVCKDENGLKGKKVEGQISSDGKFVTTLEGVTYAL